MPGAPHPCRKLLARAAAWLLLLVSGASISAATIAMLVVQGSEDEEGLTTPALALAVVGAASFALSTYVGPRAPRGFDNN